MRLSTKDIHHYLLDKGYLDARSLVDGDYVATQAVSRNAIFRIQRRQQKSLFVKQLIDFEPNNAYALQKDATCLWLLKSEPAFQEIAAVVPEYFGFDPEHQVLVTEYIPEAIDLERYCQTQGTISASLLAELARLLAAYHFPLGATVLTNRSVQFFLRQPPWVLLLGDAPAGHQLTPNRPTNPVLNGVISNPEFQRLLTGVKQQWGGECLIHGDIKWLNLLLCQADGREQIRIIDWEIADIGDPLWDVAGIFQGLILNALFYGTQAQLPLSLVPAIEPHDLAAAWPRVAEFWHSYAHHRARRHPLAPADLEKAVRYTGARLIQTAIEYNMQMPDLQPRPVRILQASYALLTHAAAIVAQYLKPVNNG